MKNTSIVIDTNVILSGLQSNRGSSYRLLTRIPDRVFDLAISVPLILEYEAMLKKKLVPKIYRDKDIDTFIDYLCRVSVHTRIHYLWRPHLKDPYDDHILELAMASKSRYIVTFNLKDFRDTESYGILAVTPQIFLSLL